MRISERLNEEKYRRGISEYVMAEEFGATQVSVNRWVSGANLPTRPYWAAIADFLGLTEDEVGVMVRQEKRGRQRASSEIETRVDRLEAQLVEHGAALRRIEGQLEQLLKNRR